MLLRKVRPPAPVSDLPNEGPEAARTFLGEEGNSAIAGIVRPTSEEQVVSAVLLANRTGKALLPISSPAGPRRQGATDMVRSVTVLDLSTMNRLIHADGRDAIAIIEPGLTFPEFDAQLRPYGLRSFKPFLPRRTKSVLACFLDRTPTISPGDHWDACDPMASLSFVFGNGQLFRTGGGSVPAELGEQLNTGLRQMMASGPIGTDYTRVLQGSQGTLGVVCWSSIYCERIPALEECHIFGSGKLEPLLAMTRELLLRQLVQHCFILSAANLSAAIAGDSDEYARLAEGGLPPWVLYISLAAPDFRSEQALAWKRDDLFRIQSECGAECLDEVHADELSRLSAALQNSPALAFGTVPTGAIMQVFCLSQTSRAAGLVAIAEEALRSGRAAEFGIRAGIYVQPMVQGVSCHVEVTLFHSPSRAAEAQGLAGRLAKAMADAGGFFSRPHGDWAGDAFVRNPGLVKHLKRVKHMFDPADVLAPGRLGYSETEAGHVAG